MNWRRLGRGTKAGRGANFTCLVSGSPISGDHIKAEGMAGRMGARLMAVVAEGRSEVACTSSPTGDMEQVARNAEPEWRPAVQEFPAESSLQFLGIRVLRHGQRTLICFTDRQLVALTTFSDLVSEAREKVLSDALAGRHGR